MLVHNATVDSRTLTVDDPKLVQGTANADALSISFDSEWDGLSVNVIFTNPLSGAEVMPAAREDGMYVVPSEVLADAGPVYVTCVGSNGGTVVANAIMRKPMIVRPRVMADSAPKPTDPTESEYTKVYRDCKAFLETVGFSLGEDGHGYVTYEKGA